MVPENTHPKFYKPRPVPIMLKPKVEDELKRLQDAGIISPVRSSSWAAPVVPVLKKDGKIRLCGDYKLTINQIAFTETYPLPRADELLLNFPVENFSQSWTYLVLTYSCPWMMSLNSI